MGTRDLLSDLRGAGLTVSADGNRLVVRPASRLTHQLRVRLVQAKPELLRLLSRPQEALDAPTSHIEAETRATGPLDPFPPDWTDDEIAVLQARVTRLTRCGWTQSEAERLAERLLKRDQDGDDRRLCLECCHLSPKGRCLEAQYGRMPGVDRRLEPVQTILQRCERFKPG